MRAGAAAVATLALVATCSVAHAAEPRRGAYVALALGPAFAAGNAGYSGRSSTGYGVPVPREVSASDGYTGVGPDLRAALGYAPANGLAVALELRGFALALGGARFPYSSMSFFALWSVGAGVDWYPEPAGPVHLGLGAGYARGALGGSTESIGAADNIDVDWLVDGPIGHAVLGYTVRAGSTFGYGPLADVTAFRLTSDDARVTGACVTLALELSWL